MTATRANCRDSFARACKVTGQGEAVVLIALSMAGQLLDTLPAQQAFDYAIGKAQAASGGEGTFWRYVAVYCADVIREERQAGADALMRVVEGPSGVRVNNRHGFRVVK